MISCEIDNIATRTLYESCAARARTDELVPLVLERDLVLARAEEYLVRASNVSLHEIGERYPMFATPETLKRLYDPTLTSYALVSYYSRLKQRTRRGLCPYCGQRDVRTLDHYLPRSKYPDFSVTPCNLVPCCRDCNSDKSAKVASTAEELCFHPFFDDWASYRLIVAEAGYSDEAGVDILFRVSTDESIPALERSRAESHVRLFNLALLYEIHGKSELIDRKRFFVETFEEGGATALRAELAREHQSRITASPNSWQTALYEHLKSNDDFPEKSRATADNVANIAFISGDVNKAISLSGPEVYLKAIAPKVLRSQCVPTNQDLWRIERSEEFWEARRELLHDSFNDFLKQSFPKRRQPTNSFESRSLGRAERHCMN